MIRLFVGLDLPDTLRSRLSSLYGSLPGARWVPPENLHLTLRFIGEVRHDVADEIDHALRAIRRRSLELAVSGTGIDHRAGRPGGMAGTLWAGIARNEPLMHLQGKIDTALQRAGLDAERRRFHPHISLARIDGVTETALAGWMQQHNLLHSESVAIPYVTLFSSLLGGDQPVYTREVDYVLG